MLDARQLKSSASWTGILARHVDKPIVYFGCREAIKLLPRKRPISREDLAYRLGAGLPFSCCLTADIDWYRTCSIEALKSALPSWMAA